MHRASRFTAVFLILSFHQTSVVSSMIQARGEIGRSPLPDMSFTSRRGGVSSFSAVIDGVQSSGQGPTLTPALSHLKSCANSAITTSVLCSNRLGSDCSDFPKPSTVKNFNASSDPALTMRMENLRSLKSSSCSSSKSCSSARSASVTLMLMPKEPAFDRTDCKDRQWSSPPILTVC
jgi:hypothetical protein